jgi:hypothetical protein
MAHPPLIYSVCFETTHVNVFDGCSPPSNRKETFSLPKLSRLLKKVTIRRSGSFLRPRKGFAFLKYSKFFSIRLLKNLPCETLREAQRGKQSQSFDFKRSEIASLQPP